MFDSLCIEKNTHYKPDEMVLQCGEKAYYGILNSDFEPDLDVHNVVWFVEARRKGESTTNYIKVHNRQVYFYRKISKRTPFPTYSEAKEVATAILHTGNFSSVSIITEIKE